MTLIQPRRRGTDDIRRVQPPAVAMISVKAVFPPDG